MMKGWCVDSEQRANQFLPFTIFRRGLQPCSKWLVLYFLFHINLFHKCFLNSLICSVLSWLEIPGGNTDLVLANHLPIFKNLCPSLGALSNVPGSIRSDRIKVVLYNGGSVLFGD